MTEIYPDIFMETISFDDEDISHRNLYVIRQEQRSLMIDTAFHTPEAMEAVDKMLKELDIPYTKLDVFLTHMHPDHAGLAQEMASRGAEIYMNPEEEDAANDLQHCYLSNSEIREASLRTIGVTKEHTPDVYEAVMRYTEVQYNRNLSTDVFKYHPMKAGDQLSCGRFTFKALDLRGHAYGQLGLYDEKQKILFSGDQVLTTIVPIVVSTNKNMESLKYYIDSMRVIKHHFKDYLILSSHFDIITDVGKEVDRIVYGYLDKCNIIKDVLEKSQGEMTVRQVGVHAYGRSEAPPEKEQFHSCVMIWAKTFSCLEYLYEQGFVKRREEDGILYWTSV